MKTNNGSTSEKLEILVVEDSITQAQNLMHLLESRQYRVKLAGDGKQALEMIAKQQPDLVVADIVMPIMNGYELCRQIKDNESTLNIPVILLTSLTNPEDVLEVDAEELSLFAEMVGDVAFALYSIDQTEEMAKSEENRALLEAQLRQSHKMEAIGQLAGGIAHDFNNMLQIINSYTEMAMTTFDPSSPIYENLLEVFKAGKRSANLTRQLLAFARKQSIQPQVLDLNEAVFSILKMLERLIGENINVSWQPATEQCLVNMDPAQVDQILANMIVNARDAIAGVGSISIKTDKAEQAPAHEFISSDMIPGNFIRLSITDSGCGMSMETLGQIFEPFFTTKDLGIGTGLGLATVYGIVKQNARHTGEQLVASPAPQARCAGVC